MIKQLQRKFIMIAMGSLSLLMVLLVVSINVINFYQVNQQLDATLDILADNEGKFPKFDMHKPPGHKPQFPINEETSFVTRYFIVKISEAGSIMEIDTSHIAAVTSGDAYEYAEKVFKEGKERGYEGNYKYNIVANQGFGYMLVFLDCRNQMQIVSRFVATSSGVALINLILVFIILLLFSKKAINPIIDSMEKQKRFISDAGHEIKTPLAIISANADVLEMTGGENEWITSIRNQTVRLDNLVKKLLTLSKMDEGNIRLVFHDFDLSRTVADAADPFVIIAETQNKQFQVDIMPGLRLHGDEGSIHQLVSTLVDNAIKYSNEEGRIKVSLSATKKGAKIEVYNTMDKASKDNLSTEKLDKLFERFYRSDPSRSRETGGYGMGLSIARSIVEAHHGRISAKCDDGGSICFTVIL